MTSRELVHRAIHFAGPDRLPFTGSMGATDFSGDTVAIFPDFGYPWWLGGGGTDEWGCRWEVMAGSGDMGQVKGVVLERLEDYAQVKVPDASDPKRYAGWQPILERAAREDKYVVVCNGPVLFERAHFLRGFEELLVDIATEPALVQKFLRHIARYHLETIDYIARHFPGQIHGYRGTDDWGTQAAAIISPAAFGAVFQPVYAEIFERTHQAGLDVWLHSCGQILEILPHLIEAGLEVVNVLQPSVFPIPRLAAFKGRLAFEVCADLQMTLPAGDRAALAREVQGLLDACCNERGGLIEYQLDRMFFASCHVDPEIGALCHEEYRRRDPFAKRPRAAGAT